MEYNGLMSFLSGIDSIIFILIYIYVALCLFKIWYPQLCEIIFKLSEIILNFLEEREENRLQRENDYLREAIKQNERTAYEDSMAIEEYEKQIKLLQHELALGYVELKVALKADGIPESESEQILNSTMDLDAEEM